MHYKQLSRFIQNLGILNYTMNLSSKDFILKKIQHHGNFNTNLLISTCNYRIFYNSSLFYKSSYFLSSSKIYNKLSLYHTPQLPDSNTYLDLVNHGIGIFFENTNTGSISNLDVNKNLDYISFTNTLLKFTIHKSLCLRKIYILLVLNNI